MADIMNKVYKSNSVPSKRQSQDAIWHNTEPEMRATSKGLKYLCAKDLKRRRRGSQASKLMTKKESSLSLNGNIFVSPFSGSCLNNVSLTGLCVVCISNICLSQNLQHLKKITTTGFWLIKKVACKIQHTRLTPSSDNRSTTTYPPLLSYPGCGLEFFMLLLQSFYIFWIPPHISQVVFCCVTKLAYPCCRLRNSEINTWPSFLCVWPYGHTKTSKNECFQKTPGETTISAAYRETEPLKTWWSFTW